LRHLFSPDARHVHREGTFRQNQPGIFFESLTNRLETLTGVEASLNLGPQRQDLASFRGRLFRAPLR
jgi:hypothetical protein